MSDVTEPKSAPAPVADAPANAPAPRREILPWVYGAGFLVLAAGLGWLWRNPPQRPEPPALAGLEQRVERLERRPAPAGPDLAPLAARLEVLEKRATVDPGAIEQRLMALEQRPAIAAPGIAAPGIADAAALMARLDALAGRQDALSARAQEGEAHAAARQNLHETRLGALEQATTRLRGLEERLGALESRLAAAETAARQVPAVAERAARLARLQVALAALEKGEKLGALPDAPAALARFANTAPPTEAALRLAFPAAARAAAEASSAVDETAPLLDRVWARAQSVLTLRQGDRVLVGDPAAGVLARARRALEAGDLAGAVAALGELQGPAAQAMVAWRAEAQALLAARAALAELAARA